MHGLQALFVKRQRMLSFHCVSFLKAPFHLRGKTVHYLGIKVIRNKAYFFEGGVIKHRNILKPKGGDLLKGWK